MPERSLRTRDPDEARALLAEVYCDHRLSISGGAEFALRQQSGGSGRCQTFALSYGSVQARVATVPFDDFVLVSQPVHGAFGHGPVGGSTTWTTSDPVALDAHSAHELRWAPDTTIFTVMLDRNLVESFAAQRYGLDDRPRVTIESGPRPAPVGQPSLWESAMSVINAQLGPGSTTHLSPLAVAGLENLAVSALFESFETRVAYGSRSAGRRPVDARTLRRAIDYIDSRLDEDVSVSEVAAHVGCGVRALQLAMRRQLDTTPTQLVRSMRLERVRAELVAADPGTTRVADIALSWGFVNLGRFARYYFDRFGVHPSQTLAGVDRRTAESDRVSPDRPR